MKTERKDLFEFIIKRTKEISANDGCETSTAFIKWFARLFYGEKAQIEVLDGKGDGKIDVVVSIVKNKVTHWYLINSKYTESYNSQSPHMFYEEITKLYYAFKNKKSREGYLNTVRDNVKDKMIKFFEEYDENHLDLVFLTNHTKNIKQHSSINKFNMKFLYFEELMNIILEYLDDAMPETDTLILSGITNILNPDIADTVVSTAIVYARVIDFIQYMKNDPLDTLFAKNVRIWLKSTEANADIENTFRNKPKEFVYSNNGITLICNSYSHNQNKELVIVNPRVVNGSQTLHAVRRVLKPSDNARVMVKVIGIPVDAKKWNKRKEIINNISVRSNTQNPIKKINLIVNDDFQLDLARDFWGCGLFYERRENDWNLKSSFYKSLGKVKGPTINELMQILSSYLFEEEKLGPVNAIASIARIIDDEAYNRITEMQFDDVFVLWKCFEEIKKRIKSDIQISGYDCYKLKFHVFAILSKFTKSNIGILNDSIKNKKIDKLIKDILSGIIAHYKKSKKKYQQQVGKELTLQVYTKNNSFFNDLLESERIKKVELYYKNYFK